MHLVGDRFSLPRNILAPFTAGSNEVSLFSRWGIWGPGDYVVRLAPDGADQHGEWLGLWIAESSTGATTWIGSLQFPRVKGEARIAGPVHSTVEVYGDGAIRPIDIPTWHVASSGPGATDIRPSGARRTTRCSARPS